MLTVEEMVEKLKTGIVNFEFEKLDGTVRSAVGTLVPEMLPDRLKEVKNELVELARSTEEMTPYGLVSAVYNLGKKIRSIEEKQNEGKEKEGVVSYYDLQKQAFRSFHIGSLLCVNGIWPYGK